MSAVQFDPNKSYTFDIDLVDLIAPRVIIRDVPIVDKDVPVVGKDDKIVGVYARLHVTAQNFFKVTQNLMDLSVSIPNAQLVSLKNFGDSVRARMGTYHNVPQEDVTLVEKALDSCLQILDEYEIQNWLQHLLKDNLPAGLFWLEHPGPLPLLLKIFTKIGKGQKQSIEKMKCFALVKNLFFKKIIALKALLSFYEKNSSSKDIDDLVYKNCGERIDYRVFFPLLQKCYRCLERLYVKRKDLFQAEDRALLLELFDDLIHPKNHNKVRENHQIEILQPDRAFVEIFHAEKTGQTVETTQKEYESILNGPRDIADLTSQGALCKLHRIFDAIAHHRSLYFDKPKNFQDIQALFFLLVNQQIGVFERFREGNRSYFIEFCECLVKSYDCLVKLFVSRKEILGTTGKLTLDTLDFFLDEMAVKGVASFPNFRTIRQHYEYARVFNSLPLSGQVEELQKMKKSHDRDYGVYLDRFVRNFIAQKEPENVVIPDSIQEDFDVKLLDLKTAALSLEDSDKKEKPEKKE